MWVGSPFMIAEFGLDDLALSELDPDNFTIGQMDL